MKLALKIDVDTYRGTREGVPRLVEMLKRHNAGASFLFSLGPDHTGRAIRRAFRPGFAKKVSRTSVLSHYGLRTLLYGTLLPGPDIGLRCASEMRAVRDAGFETGIHCWDHIAWQDGVRSANAAWTLNQMQRAHDRYREIFGLPPLLCGSAGWQTSIHAQRLNQRMGYGLASDCRGTHPFIPILNAEIVACPQLPTTLPTLDELIGLNGITTDNVAGTLLQASRENPSTMSATGHVFTLHAELEGGKFAPVFEALLAGWKAMGYRLVSLSDYAADLDTANLPRHVLQFGEVPGRSGTLAVQGPEFLL